MSEAKSEALARRGRRNGNWSPVGRLLTDHGYVKVRVGVGHPLADERGYAYEHLLVWAASGRALPGPDETLDHKDLDKENNRLDNLILRTRADHSARHAAERERDEHGRFLPG